MVSQQAHSDPWSQVTDRSRVEVWDADAEYGTAVLASSRFGSDDDPEIIGLLERYPAVDS